MCVGNLIRKSGENEEVQGMWKNTGNDEGCFSCIKGFQYKKEILEKISKERIEESFLKDVTLFDNSNCFKFPYKTVWNLNFFNFFEGYDSIPLYFFF